MKRFFIPLLALTFVLPSPLSGLAQNEAPDNSLATVIEEKIRQQAEEKVRAKKAPEPVEITAEEAVPPDKAKASFFIKEIRLQPGETALDISQVQPILKSYVGREITYAEVTQLTQKIQNYYRAQGLFVLVYPTEIDLDAKRLVLKILISKMGLLEVEGRRFVRKWKLLSYWETRQGEVLRYDRIEKDVLAMNLNPDRGVKPVLMAGKEEGSTDVHLKVTEKLPLHASHTFDNQGVKLTGKYRQGFSLRHNNLLGWDDTFLMGTVFGRRFGALFLQHVIPLNASGTELRYGFSHAQSTPEKEFKNLGINSLSQTYSLELRQRIFQSDHSRAEVYTGFDFKDRTTRTLNTATTWDRIRALTTGTRIQRVDRSGVWSLIQEFTFGLPLHGDGFPLNSRQGETKFFSSKTSLERRQKLWKGIEGVGRVQAQLSPNRLTSGEQMFLGGATSVRGYAESDFGADQAIVTNLELLFPVPGIPPDLKLPFAERPLREQVRVVSFLDHGYGVVRNPSATERDSRNMLGVGGGLRFQFRDHFSVRLEWGVPLHDPGLSESGPSQFHFLITSEI